MWVCVYYAMLSYNNYMYMKVSGVSTYRPLIKNILLIKLPAPNSNTLFERNVVNGVSAAGIIKISMYLAWHMHARYLVFPLPPLSVG